jgi:HPt (histidine-containing phosphotransfer) domain-containing protein
MDIDQLRNVTDNEPDRMQRLIDLYLTQAVPLLDGLDEAIQINASGDVARIAHKLVRSSVSCGVEGIHPSSARTGKARSRRRPIGSRRFI